MVMLLGMDGEKEPEHALDESKLLSAVFQVVDRTSVPHVPLLNIIAFILSSSTPHTLVFHAGIEISNASHHALSERSKFTTTMKQFYV